jgi:hypothetical protein
MKDNKMIKKYEYVIERTDIVDNVIFLSEYVNNHIKITLSDNRVIRVFDNKDNDMNIIELTDKDDNVTVLL